MAITYDIFDFPRLAIQSQLFYAGGSAFDGGFTSGGARTISPEPGGRAFLEVQLSLQVNEWEIPFTSWLTSKVNNGTIFRVPLVKTPQLVSDIALGITSDLKKGIPWAPEGLYTQPLWDNGQLWSSDGLVINPATDAFDGSNQLVVTITGEPLKHGHVIGVNDSSYIIDDIVYDAGTATITVNPPLRQDVTTDDFIVTRPYFLGVVTNAGEFRANYDKMNNGHIQPGRLIFTEIIL